MVPMRTAIIALASSVALLLGFIVLQRFAHGCPCGFQYDPLTGGCQVILGPVPCGSGGGGNNPGGGGSSGGSGGAATGGNIPYTMGCLWQVSNCNVAPDWRAGTFVMLFNTSA